MTQLPAAVTIADLTRATTLSSAALFEAMQTTAGVAESVSVSLTQIMTSSFGGLPTGGGTGQLLSKLSGADYSTQWSNIASAVLGTTGITTSGSTTVTVQFAAATPLSVLGVAGTTSTAPLPIVAAAGGQVLQSNAGNTGVLFSAITTTILPSGATSLPLVGAGAGNPPNYAVLTVPGGGSGTTTLTAFGVVYGNGTSTLGITAAGTTAWPLVGNGTAAAPTFQVLNVLGGGIGLTALATGDLLVASNNTTLTRLAAATTGFVLTANGTNAVPSYQASVATTKFFGGRLTLSSTDPVMIADATAQSAIFFGPYGDEANLFSFPTNATGTFITYQFTQRSLNLDPANVTSGNLYDICLATTAGAFFFGHGPAWTSTTARSAAIALVEGVWVNAAPITLRANATTTASIGTSLAVLVGTFYATANGQTGMAFKPSAATGGTNNILGLCNVFNRVPTMAINRDAQAIWTTSSTAFEMLNNNASNRISWVDSLHESFVDASLLNSFNVNTAGAGSRMGMNLNSTTATPNVQVANNNTNANGQTVTEIFFPQVGLSYVQGMQAVTQTTFTAQFNGAPFNALIVRLEM